MGGADGFVCALGAVLGFPRVRSGCCRQVIGLKVSGDVLPPFLGQVRVVRPHVGDQALLVELLGQAHGFLGR